jgi:hypothetical protein
MADDKHGEARCGGVGSDEREVEVAAVGTEDASGFVKVRGDESGREKRGLRDVLAGVIRGPRSWCVCGERDCSGEQRYTAECATRIARHRGLLRTRHVQAQIVEALDGGVRKRSANPGLSLLCCFACSDEAPSVPEVSVYKALRAKYKKTKGKATM